jgi:gliding motility-associated-like protein
LEVNTKTKIAALFIGLCLPLGALAQNLCDGEPGAAALSVDFGSGTNFGAALPPGVTNYEYTTNPRGGTYLVTNTPALNGGAWHQGMDHTPGDTDGYMLLFDATDEPGEFYNRLLEGLCPGTRYEFRVWVANVAVPAACDFESIEPDLRFELRHPATGELLGSTETGPIPTSDELSWLPYGLTFVLPDGLSSVRLLLINNAPGGCGNDLAIDDISLRICNPAREQSFTLCSGDSIAINGKWYSESGVYVDTLPGAPACNDSLLITRLDVISARRLQIDTTLCEGETFQFGGQSYRQGGLFVDTLRSRGGCDSVIAELDLSFAAFFASLYVEEDTIEMGSATQFQASASGEGTIRWIWSPADGLSCTDCPMPVARPVRTTTYSVTVTDERTGCFADFLSTITVLPCERFYVPNAFSPNRDGRNDAFTVLPGDCVQAVQRLEIYDRWGGQLYDGLDEQAVWNGNCGGKPCPVGLYVYRAELVLLDGSVVEVVGEIQLLR